MYKNIDVFINTIEKYFPTDLFSHNDPEFEENYSLDEEYEEPYIAKIGIANNINLDYPCLYIDYYYPQNKIIIEMLYNCEYGTNYGSGKDLLNRIISVSKDIGAKLLIESDQSSVYVYNEKNEDAQIPSGDFSLFKLYVLSTGESWYNKIGFYEENYEETKKLINDFIDKPIILPEDLKDDYKKYIKLVCSSEINCSVKETFNYIHNDLKNIKKEKYSTELEEKMLFYQKLIEKIFTQLLKTVPGINSKMRSLIYKGVKGGKRRSIKTKRRFKKKKTILYKKNRFTSKKYRKKN